MCKSVDDNNNNILRITAQKLLYCLCLHTLLLLLNCLCGALQCLSLRWCTLHPPFCPPCGSSSNRPATTVPGFFRRWRTPYMRWFKIERELRPGCHRIPLVLIDERTTCSGGGFYTLYRVDASACFGSSFRWYSWGEQRSTATATATNISSQLCSM